MALVAVNRAWKGIWLPRVSKISRVSALASVNRNICGDAPLGGLLHTPREPRRILSLSKTDGRAVKASFSKMLSHVDPTAIDYSEVALDFDRFPQRLEAYLKAETTKSYKYFHFICLR